MYLILWFFFVARAKCVLITYCFRVVSISWMLTLHKNRLSEFYRRLHTFFCDRVFYLFPFLLIWIWRVNLKPDRYITSNRSYNHFQRNEMNKEEISTQVEMSFLLFSFKTYASHQFAAINSVPKFDFGYISLFFHARIKLIFEFGSGQWFIGNFQNKLIQNVVRGWVDCFSWCCNNFVIESSFKGQVNIRIYLS